MENQDETVDIIAKYAKVDKDIIKEETYGGHIYSIPDPDKEGVIRFWDLITSPDISVLISILKIL